MTDEPIDILVRTDSFRDPPLSVSSDVVAQRKLHQDAMHAIVIVEPLNLLHDLVFSNAVVRPAEDDKGRLDASFGGRLHLHLDVCRRVGACSLLDDGEMGRKAGVLRLYLRDAVMDVMTELAVRRALE